MAGEMKQIIPNILQQLLHRFVMLRPVSMFFAPRMHSIDFWMLKLTKGKHTLSEFAGWTIIRLTTIGAKSGLKRTMPLIATLDGKQIGLIASSFGREHNPGWYYNLKAHPECEVDLNGRMGMYIAREVTGSEYEKFWNLGASVYVGYEAYKKRAAHRHIPVMVLEPKGK